ncbi:MAG TPA: DUF1592 domain-containing protein [Polyangiaceae bacterium]|nr:DUF1592 domain-containing protein [Polyangiaceae bacterium]
MGLTCSLVLGCSGEPAQRSAGTGAGTGGTGGTVGGSGGGGAVVGMPPAGALPASGQFRRVSPEQYGRAVRDLLGPFETLPPVEAFPAGDSLKAIAASITAVSPAGVEDFETASTAALEVVFADPTRRDALVGCAPAAWDEACATTFLQTFGRRAWRRPLAADEVTRYLALGAAQSAAYGTFADGARAMASAVLQSPNFVYRTEVGTGVPLQGVTWSRFSGYETASRLSFLLWGTIPDDQLLNAAESGSLDTVAGLQTEAQRLLASPRLVDGVNDMVDDMLALESVFLMSKDASLFPQLTTTLRTAMRDEILMMFRDVAITRAGDMLELFDTKATFVNEELGALYGIPVTGPTMVAAQHPAEVPRAGILTTALLLSVQDKRHQTSPTRRGAFVRKVLTCEEIPDPPDDVQTIIPDPPAGTIVSRKDLLASHVTSPACAACHSLMDPVGLAFENFDAIGKFRTNEENGLVIDASGDFDGTPFTTPAEMGSLMRQSEKVRNCMVRRVYRYAMGRKENEYDEAQIAALSAAFATDGQRFSPLLMNLVQNDGFLNVSPVQ